MNKAKHDPEGLPEREDSGGPIYSVSEFRREIQKLKRNAARVSNLIRLAETLSTEPRVKKTLKEALDARS